MIKQLKFVGVPTRDIEAALEFWTTKIGFTIRTDQPMGGGKRWLELAIPGAQTGITLFTPEGHEDRVGTFFNGSFACDDVDYTYRQYLARGVVFEGPPEQQPWGSFAKFKDPDGNVFVLSSR
jgi:predicted enzyme related to lactoylglutathione lyase